ncbi:hypothetical protein [Cohnella sp. WQ 127256]|uniref:hypothetical protein n=1 Tax=Cohnella sp. WQ 127256 TaxID=2938790 RepID=UPI002117461B|nr:hypothetical protein [Cohnella sp. WQ 127256]
MTTEEIDEIQNVPQPEAPEKKLMRYEAESIDTMLAITEVYEVILNQQAMIDVLTLRIEAMETSGGVE